MSISERAIAFKEMPERERPYAERYRLLAEAYDAAEARAWLREKLESTEFEKLKSRIVAATERKLSEAEATRLAKCDSEWEEHIRETAEVRAEARRLLTKIEVLRFEERAVDRIIRRHTIEKSMGRSDT